MPDDEKKKPETDGDRLTSYEDTGEHERTGFRIDETDRIKEGDDWEGIDV